MPVLQTDVGCSSSLTDAEIAQAMSVTRRLLGNRAPEGKYTYYRAAEDLLPTHIVTLNLDGTVSLWTGTGPVIGVAFGPIKQGDYGWIQML